MAPRSVLEPLPLLVKRFNESDDSNIGSADTTATSASSVLSTLAPVAIYALIFGALFVVFRRWFPRIYRPRTFLGSLRADRRTPQISETLFGWIRDFYNIPDTWILNHHTLDGFLFLRFLRVTVLCCVAGCIITWPILLPINATGGGDKKQLDILTLANVSDNYYKYFAPCGCAVLFFSFVLYTITRESIYYINLRQAYLMSPIYAGRISSRTVLYNAVPEQYMNEHKLRAMLGPTVRRIWLAADTSELDGKVGDRDKIAMKLEKAETKLIRKSNGARLKAEKRGENLRPSDRAREGGSGSLAAHFIGAKNRPTHRIGRIPLIGKKVDTIDWCRSRLETLIPEVEKMQAEQKAGHSKKLNSAFVEFATVFDAQTAFQSLTHHQILRMSPRYIGMSPSEVIWGTLRIRWWERVIRQTVAIGAVVAVVIFWSIPVAFVGAISNLSYLTDKLHFLRFIYQLPEVLLGVITGLLPSVLLAVLMSVLPIFLRLMAQQGGDPTLSTVELTVQNTYFAFQVVQVFLVATVGSAASAVVTKIINKPEEAASLLAKNLPLASTFYLSYFVVQGLGVVSGVLLGLSGLVVFMLLGKYFDKTPRKMYNRWINLSGIGWGTLFPIYTNLFVVAMCYAVIAPLVLGFAAVGLYFFYFAYRYNFMFVADSNIDTKGAIYPRGLQQLFVGLYLAEISLIGLFAIGLGDSEGALGPLILMILFLVFTALYHLSLNSALTPLITYLPKSIDAEERRLLTLETDCDVDLEATASGNEGNGLPGTTSHPRVSSLAEGNPAPQRRPASWRKWLRPDVYEDYATMRRLVPKEMRGSALSSGDERDAYFAPSVTSEAPLLWIPRDPIGISEQEVRDSSKVIRITDEGAYLDERNHIVWDVEDARPPIFEEAPDF